ncbi:MAG TPA: hypothetical protein VMF13_24385 [Luteitalea sp.]|nr:hypothetical protein [Luteitalea sp.]
MRVRVWRWWLLVLAVGAVAILAWWATRVPPAPDKPATWVARVGVLAGDGRIGWNDGPARDARFSEPFGIVTAADGTVIVADAGDSHRIRRIATDGQVSTIAGGGRGFADGQGAEARFSTPSGLAVDATGVVYVADTGNHAIRRIATDGQVTTLAGDGVAGERDGPAATARFNGPVGVAVDPSGHVIVADTYNDRIRSIDPDGEVRTLAGGSVTGFVDGSPFDARFDTPSGVAIAEDGQILVADTGNGLIRAIAPDGTVTSLTSAVIGLQRPIAVTSDHDGGVLVADEGGTIVAFPRRGDPFVVAGGAPGFENADGSAARFRRPSGLALVRATAGTLPDLLVADAGNAYVRRLTPAVDQKAGSRWSDLRALFSATPLAPPPPPVHQPAFDVERFGRVPLLWPVAPLDGPHEVAGTFGEARGEAGQGRFHAGLDVREPQGTLVRAVRDGTVASPISTGAFETLNESLRIGDLAYIHMRAGRRREATRRTSQVDAPLVDLQRFAPVYDAEGLLIRMRVKRGAAFSVGDVVGSINAFNHVHLNVGWAGEEFNPLHFRLLQFEDDIAPTIAASGVRLFDEAWQPLNPDREGPAPPRRRGRPARPRRLPPLEPVVVRGRVRIVMDAWDQANGNVAQRRLGLYTAGYAVLDADAQPIAGLSDTSTMLRFDRQRRDSDAPRQVYASGSGIPVYGAQRTQFLYVLTTSYRDGVATSGVWDTSMLAPGPRVLRVFARDFAGNETTRDLRVTVVP